MSDRERTCHWYTAGVVCGKPARYLPSILLGAEKHGMVLPVVMSVGFCTTHGRELKVADAFTDRGWAEMVAIAAGRGLPGVTKEESSIFLIELGGD